MRQRQNRKSLFLLLALLMLLSACGVGTKTGKTTNETVSIESSIEKTADATQSETVDSERQTIEPNLKAERQQVRIIGLSGPTGMGFSKLLEDSELGLMNNEYTMTIANAPDNLIAAATKNEADIIAMPSNLASVLWNKSEGEFQVLAVNTLGVLNIVEKGETIQSIADLKGKTIVASGKGAAPEYALNYLLTENGLNPETDVTIEWKAEHQEVVATLASSEQTIGLLPQPFVTVAMSKVEGLRSAVDLNQTWQALQNGSEFVMGVVVASKTFVEENPELVQQFLVDYKSSVDYVNENPAEAGALVEKFKILENAKIAEKAIPNCHIVCITGDEMQAALSGYLEVLHNANPQAVGGTLPNETLYFKP